METATRKSGKNFRHIRMELAREKEHPQGNSAYGYDLLVPLGPDGSLDPWEWAKHQAGGLPRAPLPAERGGSNREAAPHAARPMVFRLWRGGG